MKPEQKARRVREIIDKLETSDQVEKVRPLLTNGDLYVIHEVLKSAEFRWIRQAQFREASKFRRAELRVRQGDTHTAGWRKAKLTVEGMTLIRENMLAADRDYAYLLSIGQIEEEVAW